MADAPGWPKVRMADPADLAGDPWPAGADSWYDLREFETRDITDRRYRQRHSGPPNDDAIREIAASFAQGRQYFDSASGADPTVRPLLLYYGVSALSHGLVLFARPGVQPKGAHGLGSKGWGHVLGDNSTGIGNLRVELQQGLFRGLLDATGNKFYFRHRSREVGLSLAVRPPSRGCEFKLDEIAARIPDVSEQYAAWTGARAPFMPVESARLGEDTGRFEFGLPKRLEGPTSLSVPELSGLGVDDIFPADQCPNRSVDGSGDVVVDIYDGPFVPFFAQRMERSGRGRVILHQHFESGEYLNPLAACFVLSYILGTLCRYHPTTWVNLVRCEKGDAIYPFIVRATDWIQEMFPVMVADFLRGPYYFEE